VRRLPSLFSVIKENILHLKVKAGPHLLLFAFNIQRTGFFNHGDQSTDQRDLLLFLQQSGNMPGTPGNITMCSCVEMPDQKKHGQGEKQGKRSVSAVQEQNQSSSGQQEQGDDRCPFAEQR
jgi:hypothetical protein